MIRTQVQMEQETYARLKKEAARRSCSISEVVRRGIERELNQSEMSEKRRRALETAGQFRSGLSDLAERHDTYLGDEW